MTEKPKLTRKKIGDRNYNIFTKDGVLVGNVVMTGEYSRDDYPWDWNMTDDLHRQLKESDAPSHLRTGGSIDTLANAVDTMASRIAQWGLKP